MPNRRNPSPESKLTTRGLSGPPGASQGNIAELASVQRDQPIVFVTSLEEMRAALAPDDLDVVVATMRQAEMHKESVPQHVQIDVREMARVNDMEVSEIVDTFGRIGRLMMRTLSGNWIRVCTPITMDVGDDGVVATMLVMLAPIRLETGA